jgi:hypothetical protein
VDRARGCSSIRHSNIVNFFGITLQPLQLVMEFIPNGDLHQLLVPDPNTHQISKVVHVHDLERIPWRLRYRIAFDIARAMRYGGRHNNLLSINYIFSYGILYPSLSLSLSALSETDIFNPSHHPLSIVTYEARMYLYVLGNRAPTITVIMFSVLLG